MSDKTQVRALRPFQNGEDFVDENSPPFEVGNPRLAELKANGLVEEIGGAKRGEDPKNKQGAEPLNKAAQRPVTKD